MIKLSSLLGRIFRPRKEEAQKRIPEPQVAPEMRYLVAGLGNPGSEYASTRHNMGFLTLDAWAQASNVLFSTERYGQVATVSFKGRQITLLKPSTYMNLSGNAVRYWVNKLGIEPAQLVVVCDDINLPFGTLRMRLRGSDGGHNGLKSITACLETADFARIRMGVGNNFSQGHQVDYVLGKLADEELEQVPELAKRVVSGIKVFATAGGQLAQNTVNAKPPAPKPPKEDTPGEEEKHT